MPEELSRRRSLLTVALVTALLPDGVPEARMLCAWLDTWTRIGHSRSVWIARATTSNSRSTLTGAGEQLSTPPEWSSPHWHHRLGVGANALAGGAAGGAGGLETGLRCSGGTSAS